MSQGAWGRAYWDAGVLDAGCLCAGRRRGAAGRRRIVWVARSGRERAGWTPARPASCAACRAGRGPVVLAVAGRRPVGQRPAHQVRHGLCAVWPALERWRRAPALSRAPPRDTTGPCGVLCSSDQGVRAGEKRVNFFSEKNGHVQPVFCARCDGDSVFRV